MAQVPWTRDLPQKLSKNQRNGIKTGEAQNRRLAAVLDANVIHQTYGRVSSFPPAHSSPAESTSRPGSRATAAHQARQLEPRHTWLERL